MAKDSLRCGPNARARSVLKIMSPRLMNDLDIAYKLHSEIVTFWQFYVAGISAIVGWVFSRSTAWSLNKRLGISVTTLVFMVFSISGLYRSSSALHDIVALMRSDTYAIPEGISSSVFYSVVNRLNVGDWYLNIGAHVVVDVIILYFIIVVAGQKPKA
ncbi:hypothetical protein [Alteromonas sp. ASW11-130]|uniref:hypothetical protein n=1 Tax=Alteromonas sp. ASW11-130 TaxID=3015775 RepID=UPI0022419DC3|nr:hypothetical protein [Alteromonas sp. ASW11-130]MCW8092531.1 hypothetical protein [Alteromonas sp. ASW11-130]